jgi:hypothetical protein
MPPTRLRKTALVIAVTLVMKIPYDSSEYLSMGEALEAAAHTLPGTDRDC